MLTLPFWKWNVSNDASKVQVDEILKYGLKLVMAYYK